MIPFTLAVFFFLKENKGEKKTLLWILNFKEEKKAYYLP